MANSPNQSPLSLRIIFPTAKLPKAFAELAKTIDRSIIENSSIDTASCGESGLSQDAKNRMSDSILRAMEKNSNLAATLLDSNDSPADQKFTLQSPQANPPLDSRETSSPYTIVRKLGEGGLGNVWLARDEKLNRNVAIKEMNRHALESPNAWQRFEREAEITGQLEHPNVVSLYQYGTDQKTGGAILFNAICRETYARRRDYRIP